MLSSSIPRQVAREFGYSNAAIDYCVREAGDHEMNSGELVDKLWLLDFGGRDDVHGKYDFDIYSSLLEEKREKLVVVELNSSKQDEKRTILLNETVSLYVMELCLKCQKQKREILSLPCGCYIECQACSTNICFRCQQPVVETVRIFKG